MEKLAENTHMVWSRERIQQGWTYGLNEVTAYIIQWCSCGCTRSLINVL